MYKSIVSNKLLKISKICDSNIMILIICSTIPFIITKEELFIYEVFSFKG